MIEMKNEKTGIFCAYKMPSSSMAPKEIITISAKSREEAEDKLAKELGGKEIVRGLSFMSLRVVKIIIPEKPKEREEHYILLKATSFIA